jgi:DNA polymerase III delta subunit
LVASPNGKKTNLIKTKLSKDRGGLVVECYTLNRNSKENTLKTYIETNNLTLSNDVFWYVIDNFDNNYVIFIKQLQMLSLFNSEVSLISDIEKITFVDNKIEINKIFFNVFKENKILISTFNKSINSISDLYTFLVSTKSYLEIIKNSSDTETALYNFPKYLFTEKGVFLTIYKKINKDKLKKIYKSLSKAELLIRQNPELYIVIGLRFFLNLKKIVTS